MLSRKDQDRIGQPLSEAWTKKVLELLESVYGAKCEQKNKFFYVYGESYPDELAVAVSLLDKNDQAGASVTYMISTELKESSKSEVILNGLVDSVGVFFDGYFADDDWNDYQAKWQEAEFKKLKFHYKVTRENIELSLAANRLLSEDI